MRTFRLFAGSFIFAAIFAVSAFAQAGATKIGVINTLAFDDKAGITKYVNAMNSLETEFKTAGDELNTMATKIQSLQAEIQKLQDQLNDPNPKVPINKSTLQTTAQAKVEEYEKLGREYKFKQDDAKARFERRRQAVLGPIMQDIGNAMQDFAKQKGYSLILDGAKLEDAGILLAFTDGVDVTKEFITFYNARPAGTAAATK